MRLFTEWSSQKIQNENLVYWLSTNMCCNGHVQIRWTERLVRHPLNVASNNCDYVLVGWIIIAWNYYNFQISCDNLGGYFYQSVTNSCETSMLHSFNCLQAVQIQTLNNTNSGEMNGSC